MITMIIRFKKNITCFFLNNKRKNIDRKIILIVILNTNKKFGTDIKS